MLNLMINYTFLFGPQPQSALLLVEHQVNAEQITGTKKGLAYSMSKMARNTKTGLKRLFEVGLKKVRRQTSEVSFCFSPFWKKERKLSTCWAGQQLVKENGKRGKDAETKQGGH